MDHGIDAQRGIEIAIDDFGNELLGHPIKLTGLDTRCNVLDARRAAMNLVAEGDFLGIIGTLCSRAAVPVAKVLSSAGVVMISPSNSSPELTAPNLHQPIYLRTFPNDAVQGIAVARFAFEELGARTMAFVYYFNEPYSLLIRDAACEEFTSLGGECVADKVMNHGDTYISLNSIGAASPDVLYSII
jgi:branched-chain amino acid transport system substrate-binding protein